MINQYFQYFNMAAVFMDVCLCPCSWKSEGLWVIFYVFNTVMEMKPKNDILHWSKFECLKNLKIKFLVFTTKIKYPITNINICQKWFQWMKLLYSRSVTKLNSVPTGCNVVLQSSWTNPADSEHISSADKPGLILSPRPHNLIMNFVTADGRCPVIVQQDVGQSEVITCPRFTWEHR